MKKTSLADIANALGVSKTLVSMVMNGRGDQHGINKETQKRVKDKAIELNYMPNQMARSLRTGKTNTIGLIIADIANPFFAMMARSMEDYAISKGYNLIFSSSDENAEREIELIEMMRNRQVDGLIVASTLQKDNSQVLEQLDKVGFPIVLIDRYIPDTNFNYVVADNAKGAEELTQHLINAGKKKIALLTISPSHITSITDRIDGYKNALQKNNIKIDNDLIIEIPFDDVENSVAKACNSFSPSDRPDAVITLNNNLASACLRTFRSSGLRVPEDILFVSFDNMEWFELSSPTITGVDQPISNMGKKAVEIIIEKLEKKDSPSYQEKLPVDLMVRESSKC